MSPTSAHSRRRAFTLTELVVALSVSGVIFGAIFSAYLFMGRNLTRLVNFQEQEVQSRRALRRFTEDVSAAISLTTATASDLAIVKRVSTTNPSMPGVVTIRYQYSPYLCTLTRTDETLREEKILSGIRNLDVTYYNQSGTAITASLQSVKSVELAFSTAAGSRAAGTLASYATVSSRIVLRNKAALE